ncbi:MAG: hypothetical protein AAF652_17335 [Cyanobacteria bacterium P01_C01_bin.72]
MKTFISLVLHLMGLLHSQKIAILIGATGLLLINPGSVIANTNPHNILLAQRRQTVKGLSGGAINSQGCGFIANNPSYEMNLESRIDYMRFTVEAAGGQPTLLVVGPNSDDSFCVLGDEISGLKPEISGVWESGFYKIYVGNRTNSQHEFVLDISTDN